MVGVQGGFADVVGGALDVGHDGGDGAGAEVGAARHEDEGAEDGVDVHDGEEVGGKGGGDLLQVDVEGGHGIACFGG